MVAEEALDLGHVTQRQRVHDDAVDAEVLVGPEHLPVDGRHRRHADLERAQLGRALHLRRGGPEPLELGGRGVGREREPVPAVPALHRAAVRGRRVPPDDDPRAPARHRLRERLHTLEVGETTVVRACRVAPDGEHRVEVLVGAGGALRQLHAQRGELGLQVPHAHAEVQPPLRQHVEARGLLGEDERVALREDDDAGAEREPLGRGRDEREVHQRVEDRVARPHRRGRDAGVGQHDVLPRPPRVVPELLAQTGQPEGVGGRQRRPRVQTEHAELHRSTLPGGNVSGSGERPGSSAGIPDHMPSYSAVVTTGIYCRPGCPARPRPATSGRSRPRPRPRPPGSAPACGAAPTGASPASPSRGPSSCAVPSS